MPVAVVYDTAGSLDEDDMCFWVHPTDPALSTVIVNDKFAGKIFVYDLGGSLVQELPSPSPRNVDTRYGVPFGDTCIDVVAFTDRTEDIIRVYSVDRSTRKLTRIDDGLIYTHDNYGFTLYQHSDGSLWGITGDRYSGLMRQFALIDNGAGQMSGYETNWTFHETRVEGVVADDETGYYYLGEEEVGIWRVGVFDHTDRTLIARVGDATGLQGDIEGLALYYAAGGGGYLIASSQGDSTYVVYDRTPPHAHRLTFQVGAHAALGIDGVTDTDGIEVTNQALGPAFPAGLFVVQDGANDGTNQNFKLVSWPAIAAAATPPLIVDPGSSEHGGRPCLNSDVLFRNGSGVNPLTLVNRGRPDLGTPWACDLVCTGHASGLGLLWAYERPANGPLVAVGQLLVDPTSPRLFRLSAPHAGGTLRFVAPVPLDPALCGRTAALQGLCQGAPGPRLSNALDLRLGL